MRNPPFDGFTFGNPTWRDYMWFKAGLMRVVDEGRTRFLDWFSRQIRKSLGLFVDSSPSPALAEEQLLEASWSGMQSIFAYARAKQFYVKLMEEILPAMEESGAAPPVVVGAKVRRFFSFEEEAFILAVVRTHLQSKQDEAKGSLPQDIQRSSPAVLPKVLSAAVELVPHLEAQESSCGSADPRLTFQSAAAD
jgi:hypothetical protein